MSAVPPVILRASQKHTATLIFLHGLGDTGVGWAGALNTIKPPYMKVICPTANIMPVTLNAGFAMPAWYDILSLDEHDSGKREDMDGVEEARDTLDGIVNAEAGSVPRNRIMVGGFSQGGAVALYTVLKSCDRPPLAGCIALSTYIPGSAAGQTSLPMMTDGAKVTTPILQGGRTGFYTISVEVKRYPRIIENRYNPNRSIFHRIIIQFGYWFRVWALGSPISVLS